MIFTFSLHTSSFIIIISYQKTKKAFNMFLNHKNKIENENLFSLFEKSKSFKLTKFSALQTFFRIIFKNSLMLKKSKKCLEKHYGSKENVVEKSLIIYRMISLYENEVVSFIVKKTNEPNCFMRKFEREMAIFGFTPFELRDLSFLKKLKDLSVLNCCS